MYDPTEAVEAYTSDRQPGGVEELHAVVAQAHELLGLLEAKLAPVLAHDAPRNDTGPDIKPAAASPLMEGVSRVSELCGRIVRLQDRVTA